MPSTPLKYTKILQTPITDIQCKTLAKLKNMGVKVPQFVREAIAEKIQREAKELIEKPKAEYCPF